MPPRRLAGAYARLPRRLILSCDLCPGDIVMLTAAVRDLHLTHPGQFLTDVRTPCRELWEHNPHVTLLNSEERGVETIDCHYPLIHQSNRNPIHFLHGYIDFLSQRLGIRFQPTVAHGDIHLSAAEKAHPSAIAAWLGREVPFWLVVAGGKRDYTIKWWDPARYQEVVNQFRGRLLFVQVGEREHHHPALDGVLDLRGRTGVRQLIQLVYHAQGVHCPVTFLMHLAAAVQTRPGRPEARPCVVVAGGREPPSWEAYPTHQFIHTVGALPCCETGGCWRARTLPIGDGDEKDDPAQLCLDVLNLLPRCMDMITAGDVVRRIETYHAGGQFRYLTPDETEAVSKRLAASHGQRPPRERITTPIRRRCDPPPKVTVCVLTYGGYTRLIRGCLESLRRHCPRSAFRLVVGANAPGPGTLRYLVRLHREGFIDRLHISPINLNKSPMMRRMFAAGIETEYVWWLDDDTLVARENALRRRLDLAKASPSTVVAWGHRFFMSHDNEFDCGFDVRSWIRAASWYRGLALPTWERAPVEANQGGPPSSSRPAPDGRWYFLTGANWFARTAAVRALDWPDPRLVMQAEDILFGEAIRQQGWEIMDIGSADVRYGRTPSRGDPKEQTMRAQMANVYVSCHPT